MDGTILRKNVYVPLRKGEKSATFSLRTHLGVVYTTYMTMISPTEASQLNQACIADKLRLLNRFMTRLYDEALRPTGMTTSQMNILVVVAKYGEATPRQVGDWLHLEKSTLSRNVRRLQQNGWLVIRSAEKGNSHSLKLTSKGDPEGAASLGVGAKRSQGYFGKDRTSRDPARCRNGSINRGVSKFFINRSCIYNS